MTKSRRVTFKVPPQRKVDLTLNIVLTGDTQYVFEKLFGGTYYIGDDFQIQCSRFYTVFTDGLEKFVKCIYKDKSKNAACSLHSADSIFFVYDPMDDESLARFKHYFELNKGYIQHKAVLIANDFRLGYFDHPEHEQSRNLARQYGIPHFSTNNMPQSEMELVVIPIARQYFKQAPMGSLSHLGKPKSLSNNMFEAKLEARLNILETDNREKTAKIEQLELRLLEETQARIAQQQRKSCIIL